MSISRIKQIKNILKEHPVTDPRGTLLAIEQVLAQPKPRAILTLTLTQSDPATVSCVIKTDGNRVLPKHVMMGIDSLIEFGGDKYDDTDCYDPDCPVHGVKPDTPSLSEFFNKLEADALKKGGLQ